MPRIRDRILDAVIYLYPSVEDAERGEAVGGTGFLVMYPSKAHENLGFLFAVTNSHVIRENKSPVIRLNTQSGGKDVQLLTQEEWADHPDGDDLSVAFVAGLNPSIHKFGYVQTKDFVTRDFIQQNDLGPGDEVFMAGRFISHQGNQRNTPIVRFGNISMMPHEPVIDFRGHEQECYLVEMRSLAGFSGSPVFSYFPPFSIRPTDLNSFGGIPIDHPLGLRGPWLLGINSADLPFREKVYQVIEIGDEYKDFDTDYVAYSNSGQMTVIPAYRLLDFLTNDERLNMVRDDADKELAKKKASSPTRPNAMEPDKKSELTKEEFEEILKRASRKTSETES